MLEKKTVHRRFIFVKISLILICPLKVDMRGLLGRVRFNNAGYNAEYNMDILSVESRNNVTTSWRVGLFSWLSYETSVTLQAQYPKPGLVWSRNSISLTTLCDDLQYEYMQRRRGAGMRGGNPHRLSTGRGVVVVKGFLPLECDFRRSKRYCYPNIFWWARCQL